MTAQTVWFQTACVRTHTQQTQLTPTQCAHTHIRTPFTQYAHHAHTHTHTHTQHIRSGSGSGMCRCTTQKTSELDSTHTTNTGHCALPLLGQQRETTNIQRKRDKEEENQSRTVQCSAVQVNCPGVHSASAHKLTQLVFLSVSFSPFFFFSC